MTSDAFCNWLKNLDKEMKKKNKKILMFIDNCTAHGEIPNLKNIKIKYLPPNTTSKLQPLDQGIIQSFKMHYRKEVVRRFLADVERQTPTTIDVLQAMWMIAKAWNLVTEKTIANCFKKSGFKVTCEDEEDDLPLAELARTWQRVQEELHLQDTDFEDFVTFDNDLAICGELTDADIVTSVLPVTNAEADEDEEEEGEIDEHNFTIKDAYNALNTIKSVFLKKGGLSDDVVKSITKLDCALDVITHTGSKQTTINDFFSNQ
ncbi:unnamed protein product, partial [Brenthis ino]